MGERTSVRFCAHWAGRISVNRLNVRPQQHAAAPGTTEVIDPVCGMTVSDSSPHVAEFD